ncbi:tetratricopeptide repeat protein [Estrella lausannensis]|uniref:Conserved putative membrane protein n=1 Tax=Estrella lausannensis TaxID=483423 RepID=A0A0H5DQJ3_9BACT|nr:hypothetical protein [Estrella lausannensis]CRX38926.1 Conserved putative membrane protein [Estrella lausannensis]
MYKVSLSPIVIFIVSFTIVIALYIFMMRHAAHTVIEEAATLYSKGENAQTVFERQKYFNQALQLYQDIENKYDPRYTNGKLYYNIGNTFYQLNQYPFAILYYLKATKLNGDTRIQENLSTARVKAGVEAPKNHGGFIDAFSLSNVFSLPTRLQIFSFTALMGFALFSITIWRYMPPVRIVSCLFFALAAFMLLGLLTEVFWGRESAVLVNGENLRKGASMEFASVLEDPLSPGSVVDVVGEEKGGEWLKVILNGDKIGYLPAKSLRKI